MKNCQASLTEASPISWCANVVALPHDGSATGKHSIPPAIGDGLVWWPSCWDCGTVQAFILATTCFISMAPSLTWIFPKGVYKSIKPSGGTHLNRSGGDNGITVTLSAVKWDPVGLRSQRKVQVQAAVSNAEVPGNAKEQVPLLFLFSYEFWRSQDLPKAQAVLRDADPKLHTTMC
jgi:hypothetical protein